MKNLTVKCGSVEISNSNSFCLIAGPCQLETEQHAMDMAGKIKEITTRLGIGFIYKTSFVNKFLSHYESSPPEKPNSSSIFSCLFADQKRITTKASKDP